MTGTCNVEKIHVVNGISHLELLIIMLNLNVWLWWYFLVDWQDDADRKEETLAIIADLLGFSWNGKMSINVIIIFFSIYISKYFT